MAAVGERIGELTLHRRAAVWLQEYGEPAEAIRHAPAGDDPGRAADIMELAMPVMRRERQEAELARWVRALPDDVLRVRPVGPRERAECGRRAVAREVRLERHDGQQTHHPDQDEHRLHDT